MHIDWVPLFPEPDTCVTQTVPTYLEVEHSDKEPMLLLYCATTTAAEFDGFCNNFPKTTRSILPDNYTTYSNNENSDASYEDQFTWGYVSPIQDKTNNLSLQFTQSPGVRLAFCVQSWNYQALLHITYTICWSETALTTEEQCLPPVHHNNISRILGFVPQVTARSPTFSIHWTGVASNLRIFSAVFGEMDTVLALCN